MEKPIESLTAMSDTDLSAFITVLARNTMYSWRKKPDL